MYGQIEHAIGTKVTGKQARIGQIDTVPNGPTSESKTDEDAVQDTFVQQRGQEENRLGETGDRRELQEKGKLDKPLSGPQEVSPKADSLGEIESSFYGES